MEQHFLHNFTQLSTWYELQWDSVNIVYELFLRLPLFDKYFLIWSLFYRHGIKMLL